MEIKKNQERIDNVQKLMLYGQLEITEYRSIKNKQFSLSLTIIIGPEQCAAISEMKQYKQV